MRELLDTHRRGGTAVAAHPLRAMGVVVPAHNEEALLGPCLEAVGVAASALVDTSVCVAVVLDACYDRSAEAVEQVRRRWQTNPGLPYVHIVETASRNVGAARRLGCEKLLACYRNVPAHQVWLASTDADSTVGANWLSHQVKVHATGNVGWIGTVEVADGGPWSTAQMEHYRAIYSDWDGPDHPHVHGTNLGVRGDVYKQIGGFGPGRTGEDHNLLSRLTQTGLPIIRGTEAPVLTSGRTDGRAPEGFANFLEVLLAAPPNTAPPNTAPPNN